MINKKEKYSGISLLETIVYLGMFIILFTALMQFYFSIGRANQRSALRLQNERVAVFLTQHTSDVIRESEGFDSANSTYNTDLSTIRFTYGAGYQEYYVSSGVLYVTDGTDTYALSPPGITVTKFRADVSQDSGTSMYRIDIDVDFYDPDMPNLNKELSLYYIIS